MRRVRRDEIVDYQTYGDIRSEFRAQVLEEKASRRVHLGQYLTFLFETTMTVRYQVQEMMRVERIVREADIAHELATYNALLGDDGELGCTLLIELDEAELRNEKLKQWLGLPEHLYMKTASGQRAGAMWDRAQVGSDRLSSVQYLKFGPLEEPPIAIGSTHPALTLEAELSPAQCSSLAADLRTADA